MGVDCEIGDMWTCVGGGRKYHAEPVSFLLFFADKK